MAKERRGRRVILANPAEPHAGDYAYTFYDKAHPTHGDPAYVARIRNSLRGLRGERVTMYVHGARIDDRAILHKFEVRRTFVLNRYTDAFGPGSAYADAIRAIRERHSDETLVVYGLTITYAEDEDTEE